MKKMVWLVALSVLMGAMPVGAAVAADAGGAAAAPKADPKKEERRKKVEAKKAELNGSQWEVNLTALDGKGRPEVDVLTFQNGQVTSKSFAAKGFTPTNYTISVEDGNEMTVWETMQTSPKEGVVFIRGEWKEDLMRGIVSQQLEGGKTRDYSFASASKVAVDPTTKSEEEKAAEKAVKEAAEKAAGEEAERAAAEAKAAADEAAAAAAASADVPAAVEKKSDRR